MKARLNTTWIGGLVLALGLAASGAALGHGWDAGGKGMMRGYGAQTGTVCHRAQHETMRALHLAQRGLRPCPYAQASATARVTPGAGRVGLGANCPFRPSGT
jgi:hypothetical protein